MDYGSFREPTEDELTAVEMAFNEYYPYGDHTSLDEYPVVIIEDYATGEDGYKGRLALVVDGGANSTTYGFDDDRAFMISDALNEKKGVNPFDE
jgi:hypothetical protein